MTYAEKILALVPCGEMKRFTLPGQVAEVLLSWSPDDVSAETIALMADIDEDMIATDEEGYLMLSIPPEIADAEVGLAREEKVAVLLALNKATYRRFHERAANAREINSADEAGLEMIAETFGINFCK